jgi:DNA-binding response OmpR family regulator
MGKKKILVIEDDKVMLEALRIELEDADYDVDVYEDGKSGLEAAMSGKADLIVLDLVLPKMHGFDVLSALKKAKDKKVRKIPVIILTNLTQEVDREKGMEFGAVDFCVKATTDLQGLKGKIKDILLKK